jgi:phage antirepressor YoqD-like protein
MLLKSAEHFKVRFEQEQKLRMETENKLSIAKPKAEFFDQVADSKDVLQMRDVAGVLNIPGWGRNKIFDFLRKEKVLDNRNVPYREFEDRGYFRVIEQKWTDRDGETCISLKTLVYQGVLTTSGGSFSPKRQRLKPSCPFSACPWFRASPSEGGPSPVRCGWPPGRRLTTAIIGRLRGQILCSRLLEKRTDKPIHGKAYPVSPPERAAYFVVEAGGLFILGEDRE